LSGDLSSHEHSFTISYKGFSSALHSFVEVEPSIISGNPQKFKALWDTGASCSLITPKVVNSLGLAPISVGY
jgi:predicted aspartyl protease